MQKHLRIPSTYQRALAYSVNKLALRLNLISFFFKIDFNEFLTLVIRTVVQLSWSEIIIYNLSFLTCKTFTRGLDPKEGSYPTN